jgi:hypothetical protein
MTEIDMTRGLARGANARKGLLGVAGVLLAFCILSAQ